MNEQLFFILMIIVGLCFLISIPFGMLRMRFKKFSIPWFLTIHAPIPVSIIMRKIYELPFQYALLFLVFSVAGQVIGSTIIKKTILKNINKQNIENLEVASKKSKEIFENEESIEKAI